jgi:hypothetical protein
MDFRLAKGLASPERAVKARRVGTRQEAAHEWSLEIVMAPDRQALLRGIAADLKRLIASGGSQHAVAQLSSYVAMIAVSNGDSELARRWWSRAQRAAADASGDSGLSAYVAGRHAVEGIYGLYAPAQALSLADDALAVTRAPCAGKMFALGTRAMALAMLGRTREGREALAGVEAAFERLPRDVTREKVAAGGWAEQRLHHTRSYCGMYGVDGGERARRGAAAVRRRPLARPGADQAAPRCIRGRRTRRCGNPLSTQRRSAQRSVRPADRCSRSRSASASAARGPLSFVRCWPAPEEPKRPRFVPTQQQRSNITMRNAGAPRLTG